MPLKKPLILCLMLDFILAGCGGNNEKGKDEKKGNQDNQDKGTITIGIDPYNYATMPGYIAKVVLESRGYDVKIKEGQVGMLFAALADGEIDAFVDIWAPNLHGSYLKKYKGQFKMIGTLYSDTPVGIAVPSYVKKVDSIPDLKKYKSKFNGTIYAIEPGTGMVITTKKMFEVYNMDYKMVNSTAPAMVGQLKKAINDHAPIAFQAWRPHPMYLKFDIKFLKDPKNVWKYDDVKIGVVPNFKEKSPEGYKLFSNMKLKLDEVEKWMIAMADKNKSPMELAKSWVKENKNKINKWLGKQ